MSRAGVSVVFVGLCAVLAACSKPSGPPVQTPSGVIRPASTGKLTVLSPQEGEVIQGTSVLVKVGLEGAVVLEEASTHITPDTGHIHLSVDGRIVTLLAGLEFQIDDLEPGRHILEVEFAAADHAPFNPRVLVVVTFTTR